MVIKQFAPSADLAPYIRAYEIIETQDAVTRTLLPDTCVIIGFRYAGSARLLNDERMRAPLPNISVTGLRTSVREMHTTANSGIILAKFRAAGAAPFFREPLHQLFGSTCSLRSLNDDVADDDASADDAAARIRAIRIS